MTKGTIIRTSILILALLNTSLQLMGWDVLPFTEQDVEIAITVALNAGAAITVWWRNNSITKEAQKADQYLEHLKGKK